MRHSIILFSLSTDKWVLSKLALFAKRDNVETVLCQGSYASQSYHVNCLCLFFLSFYTCLWYAWCLHPGICDQYPCFLCPSTRTDQEATKEKILLFFFFWNLFLFCIFAVAISQLCSYISLLRYPLSRFLSLYLFLYISIYSSSFISVSISISLSPTLPLSKHM